MHKFVSIYGDSQATFVLIGHIPHDGVPMKAPSTVILPVALTVILLNVGGIAFALICLIFNIVYRNKK